MYNVHMITRPGSPMVPKKMICVPVCLDPMCNDLENLKWFLSRDIGIYMEQVH